MKHLKKFETCDSIYIDGVEIDFDQDITSRPFMFNLDTGELFMGKYSSAHGENVNEWGEEYNDN